MKAAETTALWLFFALVLTKPGLSDDTKTLYILTVLPYPSEVPSLMPSWSDGTKMLPAMYLAVEMINNRSDVLNGYTLDLINDDGGCDFPNNARVSFVKHTIQGELQPILGVVGPGCSTSTLAFSSLSGNDIVSLINIHLAGSPRLENRTKFPFSISILGSSYGFVNSTVALMNRAGWKRIAVLYEEGRVYFLSTFQALQRDLSTYVENAELVYFSALHETHLPIDQIKARRVRAITVLAGPEYVRMLLCLAYHKNVIYPKYQWILKGRGFGEFEEDVSFTYLGQRYSCTADVLSKVALNGSILTNYQLSISNESMTGGAGITYKEYLSLYEERVELYNNREASYTAPGDSRANASTTIWATLVFDAVWALAFSLDKAQSQGMDLLTYSIGSLQDTNIIRESLYSTKFYGMSGYVSFDRQTGFIKRIMDVSQVFDGNETNIGYVQNQILVAEIPPVLVRNEFQNLGTQLVLPGVAALFSVLTIILLILMAVLHAVSTVQRDHPSVKAQSPKLNQISYIGAYLFAIGSLLYIISRALPLKGSAYGYFCQFIWAWFFSVGVTAFFAPICARTWRLYRIFTHYLHPGPFISDPVLFSAVFILIAVDVVLAILWTAIDPFLTVEERKQANSDGDYEVRLSCECTYPYVWFILTYSVKVVLLIATLVLSLLTRTLRNKKFKASSLRVLVYLFALVWVIGLTLYYFTSFLDLDIHVDYTILATMCVLVLLSSLVLVFLPPILPLLKEKVGPHFKRRKTMVFGSTAKYVVNISTSVVLRSNQL